MQMVIRSSVFFGKGTVDDINHVIIESKKCEVYENKTVWGEPNVIRITLQQRSVKGNGTIERIKKKQRVK